MNNPWKYFSKFKNPHTTVCFVAPHIWKGPEYSNLQDKKLGSGFCRGGCDSTVEWLLYLMFISVVIKML